ncbi:ferredoxin [Streptomyces achmelvichensis]|uniref:ferredoxin n=1 Tax=Streptomyces achmelvichensis TaxID=3134111 RepID=UPI003C12C732
MNIEGPHRHEPHADDEGKYQVLIDPAKCLASGICIAIDPEIFRRSGRASAAPKQPVPYRVSIVDAQELCPSGAISFQPVEVREDLQP